MSNSISMRQLSGVHARFRAASFVAIAATTLALGGCREQIGLDDATARTLGNPETRHPIAFSSRTEALYVEVLPGGEPLSRGQEADVRQFVERYKIEGTGRLAVASPAAARGHMAASRPLRQVMDVVADAGLPPDAVTRVRARRGETGDEQAIRIAYERAVAVAPECGDWPENLAENRERIHYANFGCATQRNLALSVANARDLQHPQFETPAAGERRTVVWSKYAGAPQSGTVAPAGPATPMPIQPPGGAPPRAP